MKLAAIERGHDLDLHRPRRRRPRLRLERVRHDEVIITIRVGAVSTVVGRRPNQQPLLRSVPLRHLPPLPVLRGGVRGPEPKVSEERRDSVPQHAAAVALPVAAGDTAVGVCQERELDILLQSPDN